MADYIDREKLLKQITEPMNWTDSEAELQEQADYQAFKNMVENAPVEDVVDIETLKKWLYKIAFNNVGCKLEGDFSDACEEIISRLDGLKRFVKETREDVVPRSEVEDLKCQLEREREYIEFFKANIVSGKQEVAKQIFEEFSSHISIGIRVLKELINENESKNAKNCLKSRVFELYAMENFIDELKKKYIGE